MAAKKPHIEPIYDDEYSRAMEAMDTGGLPESGKLILDVCCGSRMFWFDKENPLVLFNDIRNEEHTLCDGRKLSIKPDTQYDFRCLPFVNETFRLVVFDPPHLDNLGEKSWMFKKYGGLSASWREDLSKGFDECMRVLKPNGVLVFKWNESRIKTNEVLKLFKSEPLFGHTSGRQAKTHWCVFMKEHK